MEEKKMTKMKIRQVRTDYDVNFDISYDPVKADYSDYECYYNRGQVRFTNSGGTLHIICWLPLEVKSEKGKTRFEKIVFNLSEKRKNELIDTLVQNRQDLEEYRKTINK